MLQKDRPFAVGGISMISTASYTARKFGVRRWAAGRQHLPSSCRARCTGSIRPHMAAHCTAVQPSTQHPAPLMSDCHLSLMPPVLPCCRSAMPGFIAVKLCPQLLFVKPDFAKYKAASDRTR